MLANSGAAVHIEKMHIFPGFNKSMVGCMSPTHGVLGKNADGQGLL